MSENKTKDQFCFVLIPKDKAFLNLWDSVIKPAVEKTKMIPLRAVDVVQRFDHIMEGVRKHIIEAEVIIAVLTGQDANVMYELGLAHAAKKKVIMLIDQGNRPPSDFSHIRCFSYDPDDFPLTRDKLTEWLLNARRIPQSDDLFPELPVKTRQENEEYEYLKQIRKILTIRIKPKTCSIFFNNRLLGESPQTIYVNPDAERNVISISAGEHFDYYRVLNNVDLEKEVLRIEMEPRDKKKLPERVNFWLMKRREDPDNPVLSLAIFRYLMDQGKFEEARDEIQFCISKAPEWAVGYNNLGYVESKTGNHKKAEMYYRITTDLNPYHYIGWYNIACVENRLGNFKTALEELKRIIHSRKIRESYRDIYYQKQHPLKTDPDFDPIRNHPDFKDKFQNIVNKFDEFVSTPEPSLISEASPDIHQGDELEPLPCSIKQVQIESFQCIRKVEKLTIPVDCPWVFFTGENGDGKTALLQALTIGMCGTRNAGALLPDTHPEDCKISVEYRENGRDIINNIEWFPESNSFLNVKERPGAFCAYGPSRLRIQSEHAIDEERSVPEKSLFEQRGPLLNIQAWIKNEKLKEETDPNARKRRRNVMRLLEKLLPNISRIDLRGSDLIYREKGFDASIYQIASGHKSILAMVGDMLIRLFETRPDEVDPKNLSGIVVIDELDVHIHPAFLRKFPKLLSETFPRVQFICSTHSPIPLLGAPKGSKFYLVERDELEGTKVRDPGVTIRRLLPNAILTSPLFGLDSITSEQNKDISEVRTEDDYQEILKQDECDGKLRQYAAEGRHIPKEFMTLGDEGK